MMKMCIGLHVKWPLFLSEFNESWIFSTDFRTIFKHKFSWKSVLREPECSIGTDGRMDTQTDMKKLMFAFCNFANSPEKKMLCGLKSAFLSCIHRARVLKISFTHAIFQRNYKIIFLFFPLHYGCLQTVDICICCKWLSFLEQRRVCNCPYEEVGRTLIGLLITNSWSETWYLSWRKYQKDSKT